MLVTVLFKHFDAGIELEHKQHTWFCRDRFAVSQLSKQAV
jgi:hypothetical protein